MPSTVIRFTSSQSPTADSALQAILDRVSAATDVKIDWRKDGDWQDREGAFDRGDIQMAWICGLPYVWKADNPDIDVELLAAPVMAASRYKGRPVYYSDVIVHAESKINVFEDLKGHSWAVNEPKSHSGYNITRYHLAHIKQPRPFFGKVIEAGAHQIALRQVIRRKVDASAIDSTVLESELRLHPEFGNQIRIIERLGPSPIPPWAIHKSVSPQIRRQIRAALLSLHEDQRGRLALEIGDYASFAQVEDVDYDPIRQMYRKASTVKLL